MNDRLEAVARRRSEWAGFSAKLKGTTLKYEEIFKKMRPWGGILIHDNAVTSSVDMNQRGQPLRKEKHRQHLNACSISLGNYPLGISYAVYNVDPSGKRFTGKSVESEAGACLSFSQLPSGEVALIFFPAQSKVHEFREYKFIYKIFKSPAKIKDQHVEAAIRFLIEFGWFTSALGSYHGPRYWLFRFRIWWKRMDMKTLLKATPYAGRSFAALIGQESKDDA